jgi:hypothetical protein
MLWGSQCTLCHNSIPQRARVNNSKDQPSDGPGKNVVAGVSALLLPPGDPVVVDPVPAQLDTINCGSPRPPTAPTPEPALSEHHDVRSDKETMPIIGLDRC